MAGSADSAACGTPACTSLPSITIFDSGSSSGLVSRVPMKPQAPQLTHPLYRPHSLLIVFVMPPSADLAHEKLICPALPCVPAIDEIRRATWRERGCQYHEVKRVT